jgi:hypothetical protein
MTNKDLVPVIQKELAPIVDSALSIKAVTAQNMPQATELLSRLNILNDRIEAEEDKITVPLEQALKAERARWKPAKSAYKTGIDYLRNLISVFQTNEVKRIRAEEAKVAQQINDGKITLEKGIKKIDKIEQVEEKVKTDNGSVSFREDQVLKITDRLSIPKYYWIVDEDLLLADLKAGKVVTGAELDIQLIPINRRK